MKRLFVLFTGKRWLVTGGILLVAAIWLVGRQQVSLANQPLTPEVIAKIEPELCETSPWRQVMTIIPIIYGSPTRSLEQEQIGLVDQFRPTGWRKVWVMRLPAAYVTQRTCDVGRQNWVGSGGDDLRVGQHYHLSVVLTADADVPATHATRETYDAGVPLVISVTNRVWDPSKRREGYAWRTWVNERKGVVRCREDENEIAGLVRFRRIDPSDRGGTHCGSLAAMGTKWEEKVYGRKIGENIYDFIAKCSVNCRVFTDYKGWDIELSFPYDRLSRWEFIQDRVKKLFDHYTAYIELDMGERR